MAFSVKAMTVIRSVSSRLSYDSSKSLAKGASKASVYLGTYNNNNVAVKKIMLENVGPIDREVQQLNLNHTNVLKMFAVEEDINFKYYVLELCSGTLEDVCHGTFKGPPLPPDEVVLYQLLNGLRYIHSKRLVHRDIKPENILISSTLPVQMKLSDFGLCKQTTPECSYSISGPYKGTLNWMAPELLETSKRMESNNETNITRERGTIMSDVFSLGCVVFYFFTRGKHPFRESHSIKSQGNFILRHIQTIKNSIGEYVWKVFRYRIFTSDFIPQNIIENACVGLKELPPNHFAYSIVCGMIEHAPEKRWGIQKVIDELQLKKPNIKTIEDGVKLDTRRTAKILAAYDEAHRALRQTINQLCNKSSKLFLVLGVTVFVLIVFVFAYLRRFELVRTVVRLLRKT